MSLSAAHKSERSADQSRHVGAVGQAQGGPFARAAGTIFALFDRVPGLRSVIAPLRRNPNLNPLERHRIEREALERRHQRERFALDRRYRALDRLERHERRSLQNKVRRQIREMETARELQSERAQDAIEVNKLDVTLPDGKFRFVDRKLEAKDWKARQGRLDVTVRQNQKRASPLRYRRED